MSENSEEPNPPTNLVNIGDLYSKRRRLVEEINTADGWLELALQYEGNNFSNAEVCYRKALDLDGRCFAARYKLALLEERADRLPEALNDFNQCLDICSADQKSQIQARIDAINSRSK